MASPRLLSNSIAQSVQEHLDTVALIMGSLHEIEVVAVQLAARLDGGGKICWMGNGGSAAESQHLAAELVGRFVRERHGIASLAFTTDTSALTSIGNDYGYDRVFARQIEALCSSSDAVVGISTSGNSLNVCEGVRTANSKGAYTVGLLGGNGGELARLVDKSIVVPAKSASRVQEVHLLIGHILCDWIESHCAGGTR